MSSSYSYSYRSRPPPSLMEDVLSLPPFTLLAYVILLILGAYYVFQRIDVYPLLPFEELLWNCLVCITPDSLILALDKQGSMARTAGREQEHDMYSESRIFAAKGEAMRRILGLDGTGLLSNLQRARTLTGFTSALKAHSPTALPGLGNWDNSCYQNSVIQGLASLSSMSEFLEEAARETRGGEQSTSLALRGMIEELNSPKNAGKRFWTPDVLKSMSSWQQQDAQEYYSKVVDEVEKEIARTLKDRRRNHAGLGIIKDLVGEISKQEQQVSHIPKLGLLDQLPDELASLCLSNPLEGLLAQRVGCLQCGFVEGLTLVPFNCLTLPLGKQWEFTVQSCLGEYTKLESINGVECVKCTLLRQMQQLERLISRPAANSTKETEMLYAAVRERLKDVNEALENCDFSESTLMKKLRIDAKGRVTATKSRQAVVARAPKSLVLHVNRSLFDEATGTLSKNYANVSFPAILDLRPWCLGYNPSEAGDGAAGPEIWNMHPAESMLDVPSIASSDSQMLYSIKAVVTHYGRHENGHYICYRRDPNDADRSAWWRLSDDEVTRVSEQDVLDQGGVFMLFYEKVINSDEVVLPPTTVLEAISSAATTAEEEEKEGAALIRSSKEESIPSLDALADPPIQPPPLSLPSITDSDTAIPDVHAVAATHQTAGKAEDASISTALPPKPAVSGSAIQNSSSSTSPTPFSFSFSSSSTEPEELADAPAAVDTPTSLASTSPEKHRVAPRMRTAGAKSKRGSASGKPGQRLGSISSMVTAN